MTTPSSPSNKAPNKTRTKGELVTPQIDQSHTKVMSSSHVPPHLQPNAAPPKTPPKTNIESSNKSKEDPTATTTLAMLESKISLQSIKITEQKEVLQYLTKKSRKLEYESARNRDESDTINDSLTQQELLRT